jgi:hypothetical protein
MIPKRSDKKWSATRVWLYTLGVPLGCVLMWLASTPHRDRAMTYAADEGDVRTMQFLVAVGTDCRKSWGRLPPPIILASAGGHKAAVIFLLNRGVDPNTEFRDGLDTFAITSTPLLAAVFYKHLETVELLMQRGADPNQSNQSGMTPIQMARDSPDTRLRRLVARIEPEGPLTK